MGSMRRIVLGVGPSGRSTVVADGGPDVVFGPGPDAADGSPTRAKLGALPGEVAPGRTVVAELWATHTAPPSAEDLAASGPPDEWDINCPPGTTRWRYIEFGPGIEAALH